MAKYIIDETRLKAIADNVRAANEINDPLSINDIIDKSTNLEVIPDAYILVDDKGNEIVGVVSDEPVTLTATVNDVRKGCTFASDYGVKTGEKDIPAYHTFEGYRAILPGKPVEYTTIYHEFTKLQAILCNFNTSMSDSVAAEKVMINGNVYNVQSAESIASIISNTIDGKIDFGITNDTEERKILRYFYYKEEL